MKDLCGERLIFRCFEHLKFLNGICFPVVGDGARRQGAGKTKGSEKQMEDRQDLRVHGHPVLGDPECGREVTIFLDGRPLKAREGEPVAAALFASGIRVARYTGGKREPRGPFCMIGRCTECRMLLEGKGTIMTCLTPVEEGMRLRTPGGGEK